MERAARDLLYGPPDHPCPLCRTGRTKVKSIACLECLEREKRERPVYIPAVQQLAELRKKYAELENRKPVISKG